MSADLVLPRRETRRSGRKSAPSPFPESQSQLTPAAAAPSPRPVIFFFGQAGDFQRLWLADAAGIILAEDNHSSLAAITCPPNEKRQPLPPHDNNFVTVLKTNFDQQYQDDLAAGGTPHRLTVTQRWALEVVRDAYKQTTGLLNPPPDAKDVLTRLERLRKLWSVSPIEGRVEFLLRGLKNQKPALEEAIAWLESPAFEGKLDVLVERQTEVTKLVTEPAIICAKALR